MSGLKIKIDTNSAQRASAELRKQLKALGAEAGDNEKEFKKLEKRLHEKLGADKAEKAVKDLEKSLGLTKRETAKLRKEAGMTKSSFASMVTGGLSPATLAMAGLTAAFAGFTTAAVLATKSGMEFEQSMKTVGAVSRASAGQFAALKDEARKMGATTEWSANQAAQALKYLAMSGMTANQSIQALPGMLNLATAAQMDLASASDIATDALTAFGLGTNEMERLTDSLVNTSTRANTTVSMLGQSFKTVAPVAANMGYSIEQTSAMLGVLANSGIKAERAGTSLRQALLKTGKAAKSLGMDAGSSLIDVLKEMKRRQFSVNDVTKEFGLIASTGVTVLMNNVGAYQKLNKEIENSRGATKKLSSEMRDSLSNDFKILGSALEESGLKMYDVFSPDVRQLVQDTTKAINNSQEAFKALGVVISAAATAADWFVKAFNAIPSLEPEWIKKWMAESDALQKKLRETNEEAAGLFTFKIPKKTIDNFVTQTEVLKRAYLKTLNQKDTQEKVSQFVLSYEKSALDAMGRETANLIKAKEKDLATYKQFENAKAAVIAEKEKEIQKIKDQAAAKSLKAVQAENLKLHSEEINAAKQMGKDLWLVRDQGLQDAADREDAYREKETQADYDADQERLKNEKETLEKQQKARDEDYADFSDTIQETTADILKNWDNAWDTMLDILKNALAQMAAEALSSKIIVPIAMQAGSSLGLSWNGQSMSSMSGGGTGATLPGPTTLNWAQNNVYGMGWLGSTIPGTAASADVGAGMAFAQGNEDAAAVSAESGLGTTWGTALGAGALGGLGYSTIGSMVGLPQNKYTGVTSGLGGAAGYTIGAEYGSYWGPIGTAVGSIAGGLLGSLFGSGNDYPKIKMGSDTSGYKSAWGYGLNPDNMGHQDQIAPGLIKYFDSYFQAIDNATQVSLKQAMQDSSYKTVGAINKYDTNQELFTAMANDIFKGVRGSLVQEMGLSAKTFNLDFFKDLAGEGGDLFSAFAGFEKEAEAFANFNERITKQLNSGLSLKEAYANFEAITNILNQAAAATKAMASSSTLTALEGLVNEENTYTQTLKTAYATQEEITTAQQALYEKIGGSVSGLTVNAFQAAMIEAAKSGGSVTESIETMLNKTMAQAVAASASESIYKAFLAPINKQIGEAVATSMVDGAMNGMALASSINDIMNGVDWNAIESSAASAMNAISGLVGPTQKATTAIQSLSQAEDAVSAARNTYLTALQTEQSKLQEAYNTAKTAYISGLQAQVQTLQEKQKAVQEAYNTAKTEYISGLNNEITAKTKLANTAQNTVDSFTKLADSIAAAKNQATDSMALLPNEQYAVARSRLQDAVTSNNQDLIPGLTTKFLSASLKANTSASGYQKDYAYVMQLLDSSQKTAEAGKTTAQQQLDATNQQIATLNATLNFVKNGANSTADLVTLQSRYNQAKTAFDNNSYTSQIATLNSTLDFVKNGAASTADLVTLQNNYNIAKSALDNSWYEGQIKALEDINNPNSGFAAAFKDYFKALEVAISLGSGASVAELQKMYESMGADLGTHVFQIGSGIDLLAAGGSIFTADQVVQYVETASGAAVKAAMAEYGITYQDLADLANNSSTGNGTATAANVEEYVNNKDNVTPVNNTPVTPVTSTPSAAAIYQYVTTTPAADVRQAMADYGYSYQDLANIGNQTQGTSWTASDVEDYLNNRGFATGGTVFSPTLALVGEGGEAEHITPDSQMKGVKEQLKEIKQILFMMVNTNGDQNKYAQKMWRILDASQRGERALTTEAAA